MKRKTAKVLGYDVDLATFSQAVDTVMREMQKKEGLHIVTINPEIIDMASKNQKFSDILKNAQYVVADGSGIVTALRMKGIEQQQIPGIDFAHDLLEQCSKNNFKVALIGAKEEVVQKTVRLLKNEFEGLKVSYYRNGYFLEKDDYDVINQLAEAEPSLVLVAMGVPRQDFFIQKCKEKIPNAVYMGVGGSFDVWSGYVPRAPEFYRLMGMEWLYRTIKQPQRIKRIYKTLPLFLFRAIMDSIKDKGIFFKKENNE